MSVEPAHLGFNSSRGCLLLLPMLASCLSIYGSTEIVRSYMICSSNTGQNSLEVARPRDFERTDNIS